MTAPIVLGPGDGESAAVGPISFTIKATGEDTNGMYSLVEANGPTFATPHVHHAREEAFYVVEGTVTFLAREDTVTVGAGSYLLVPRETMHGFRSEGDSKILITHSPGGFEVFFRELAAAVQRGGMDQAFRDKLAVDVGVTYHDDITF
jgi:mannose-6-phosphate isomerase-like protein (cupin superfamily)